jgi:hypothetical protein
MSAEFTSSEGFGSLLFGTSSVDVVGIYSSDFSQVFTKARPIKLSISPPSKLMDHPVETGVEITDFRIILPVEIEISLILSKEDYRDTYQEIIDLFNAGELLTVQTYASTYQNQVIVNAAHEESTDVFNALTMLLKMREVKFVSPSVTIAPKNKKDAPTQNRGSQSTSSVPAKNESSIIDGINLLKPRV